jgi:uncharacterized membrane protein
VTSLERTISIALRAGVLVSALIAAVGGTVFLVSHGAEPASFGSPPASLRPLSGSTGIVALGILVLIATPVVRVALLVIAFARQRDVVFASLSALVLTVLLVSLV